MTGESHPSWSELVDAAEAGDGAASVLRRVRDHAGSCPQCRREWERIETLLSLMAERRTLRQPPRRAMEGAFRAVQKRVAARGRDGLSRVWAIHSEPVGAPALRSSATQSPERLLYSTPEHRVALTILTRDQRRILRGQVVPESGTLPASRLLYAEGVDPVTLDEFGQFVLDPLPEGLQDLEIQLGDLVIQLVLPPD